MVTANNSCGLCLRDGVQKALPNLLACRSIQKANVIEVLKRDLTVSDFLRRQQGGLELDLSLYRHPDSGGCHQPTRRAQPVATLKTSA